MHENSFSVIISREIQRRGKLLGRQRRTKKTVARKHIPIPKSATPRDQLSPTPLVGDVNEECVCGAGASDGFPDGWTCGVSRPRSLLHVPRPQRSPSGQSRSVGSECRRLEESRAFLLLRTIAVAPPWFWDFFGTGTCGEVKPGDVSRERECEKINRRQPQRTSLVWYWNSLAAMAKHSRFVDSLNF